MAFPLLTDCEQCVCQILNSKPLFTLKFYDEILDTPTGSVRLDFTRETPSEAADITRAYAVMTRNNGRADSSVKSFMAKMDKKSVTKGHFFRGVE